MPSLRVGNSSSFERTSSPFVTFPKTAYCQQPTIPRLKKKGFVPFQAALTQLTILSICFEYLLHPLNFSLILSKGVTRMMIINQLYAWSRWRAPTCPSRWGAFPRSIENDDPALSGSLYLHADQHHERTQHNRLDIQHEIQSMLTSLRCNRTGDYVAELNGTEMIYCSVTVSLPLKAAMGVPSRRATR